MTDDCWTVSTIISSDSQKVAAGLTRLAVESSGKGKLPAVHQFLGLETESPVTPTEIIQQLESGELDLPDPTREVFLYLPMDLLRLSSVIEAYSDSRYNLPRHPDAGISHVFTGNEIRNISSSEVVFPNGIRMDLQSMQTFIVNDTGNRVPVVLRSTTIVKEMPNGSTQVIKTPQPNFGMKLLAKSGTYEYQIVDYDDEIEPDKRWLHLVILESSGTFMFLDDEFYNSNLIQMVAMQKYDRELWELVFKNSYARVFRLKDIDAVSWSPSFGEPGTPAEVISD